MQEMQCKRCYHRYVCDRCERMSEAVSYNRGLCIDYKAAASIVDVPCRIGDKVYYIPTHSIDQIITVTVVAIHLSDEGAIRRKKHKSHLIGIEQNSRTNIKLNLDDFGILVFTDRKEAEKALRKRKRDIAE